MDADDAQPVCLANLGKSLSSSGRGLSGRGLGVAHMINTPQQKVII